MKDSNSSARGIASEVLLRVATDDAFATPALDAALSRAKLDDRDARLATQLTYGSLRVLPVLDDLLDAHLKRPRRLDPWVRAVMRVAAFQIVHLERVPKRAAVNEAVNLVRERKGQRLAGLANAVLRKIERPETPVLPTELVLASWLRKKIEGSIGRDRCALFCSESRIPPRSHLRSNIPRQQLVRNIVEARPNADVVEGSAPEAVLVHRAGDLRALPGFDAGDFSVQEQGSQWLGELIAARPGERVLDACAGRGGKSEQIARQMKGQGHLTAVDLYPARVEQIGPRLTRALPSLAELTLEPLAIDWTLGNGGLQPASFDRVFVDAPCSGLGTLARRPEIQLRVSRNAIRELVALQRSIAAQVTPLVKPGGLLIAAVCSPLTEELGSLRQGVKDASESVECEMEPVRLEAPLPLDKDGALRIGPWSGECDAYQLMAWRRIR